jgi:hypothetical protein
MFSQSGGVSFIVSSGGLNDLSPTDPLRESLQLPVTAAPGQRERLWSKVSVVTDPIGCFAAFDVNEKL